MWRFKPKKSKADRAIEWMPRAIEVAAEKWREFERLPFKNEVPLEDRIFAFSIPLGKGLRQWKAFEDADDTLFLIVAAKGVEKAGSYSSDEIASALGLPYLPR